MSLFVTQLFAKTNLINEYKLDQVKSLKVAARLKLLNT